MPKRFCLFQNPWVYDILMRLEIPAVQKSLIFFFQTYQLPQTQKIYSSCPIICATTCVPDCPMRCCKHPLPYEKPSVSPVYCTQTCSSFCSSSCPAECCKNAPQAWTRTFPSFSLTKLCPADCDSTNCFAKCPPQCCREKIDKSKKYLSLEDLSQIPSAMIAVRSKLVCPATCYDVCSKECAEPCCRIGSERDVPKNKRPQVPDHGNTMLAH